MLIIEKKKDISILYCLGADESLIRKIFYREGLLITLTGLCIGMLVGSAVALIQENFGLIKLHGGFIIDAYPIDMQWIDMVIVALTVLLIGTFSSWYPVKFLLRHHISGRDIAK
jgi:ABC-type lipoprotein release transport system permease subunit